MSVLINEVSCFEWIENGYPISKYRFNNYLIKIKHEIRLSYQI